MAAMAMAAHIAPVRAPAAGSPRSARISARRTYVARSAQLRNVTARSKPKRDVRPAASLGPNEVNELATSTLLTLSGLETVLGKVSFGSLLTATSIYEYKVRHKQTRNPQCSLSSQTHKLTHFPKTQAFFTDEKRAGKLEQYAMLGGNLSLASLLAARWVESGHFPLSNMYESLLFLAWGITGVHLVVTERDGFSKSAVPGALAAPTAAMVVAGATLALPAELQRASALVPALKSNWLMMHVSVMMLSYATLLVGSLACMSFLVVDASQGFAGAKKTLGFLDDLVTPKEGGMGSVEDLVLATSATGVLETGDATSKVRNRDRPKLNANGEKLSSSELSASSVASEFPETPLDSGDRLLKEMDNLSYRCLGAGFALLTAGLISGAVWANEAWGSYWSWDPKETWALITWFTYATYLHSRLVAGKSKKEVATIGSLGFIVVWVCYVGVNLWGVGLHSYGWFANK